MSGEPNEVPAADRARWLAELSDTLNEAHHLLLSLDVQPALSSIANELYLRIEAARLEVQSLRLSRSLNRRPENPPNWSESSPWPREDQTP